MGGINKFSDFRGRVHIWKPGEATKRSDVWLCLYGVRRNTYGSSGTEHALTVSVRLQPYSLGRPAWVFFLFLVAFGRHVHDGLKPAERRWGRVWFENQKKPQGLMCNIPWRGMLGERKQSDCCANWFTEVTARKGTGVLFAILAYIHGTVCLLSAAGHALALDWGRNFLKSLLFPMFPLTLSHNCLLVRHHVWSCIFWFCTLTLPVCHVRHTPLSLLVRNVNMVEFSVKRADNTVEYCATKKK